MATTIVTKYGSDAPAASDLVRGELAVDTENGRLYTENSSGAVVEIGLKPSGNVDVTGSVTVTGTASGATASSVGNKVVIDDGENGISILSSTSGAGYLIFGDSDDNDVGMLIYDHSANALRTYVNGAERATISSAGNVTFTGTVTGGNGTFTNLTINAGEKLRLDGAGGHTFIQEVANDTMVLATGGTERMRISGGNVGIGVTPNYPIHVEKSVDGDWMGKIKNTHATNGYGLLIHAGDDSSVTALSVGNYAGAGDYLVVKGDGSVGIGTASPVNTGSNYGDLTINGTDGSFISLQSGGSTTGVLQTIGTETRLSTSVASGFLTFRTGTGGSGTEVMRISGDNVTIKAAGADASRTLSIQGTNGSSQTYQFNIVADGENSAAKFMVGSGGGAASEVMQISGGNVGVGLSSGISSKLHVNTEISIGADGDNRAIVGYTPNRFYIGTRQSGTNYFDTVNVSGGNVGIGNSTVASTRFAVTGSVVGANIETTSATAGHEALIVNRQNSDGTAIAINKAGTTVGSIGTEGGDMAIGNDDAGIQFVNGTEHFRPFNMTTNSATDALMDIGSSSKRFKDLYLSGDCKPTRVITNNSGDWGMEMQGATIARIRFHTSAGGSGEVGSVTVSTTSTAYNTSSDYRLKENVVPLTSATERLKQLNPSRFNFIADADKTVDGFLAHEVQNVVPEAISGTKDAMRDEEYEVTPVVLDDDGNVVTEAVMGTRSVPDYQGIDQSKLVPLLVATIQELEARIAALES